MTKIKLYKVHPYLDFATLLVVGEVGNVHLTGKGDDDWSHEEDLAVRVQDGPIVGHLFQTLPRATL